MASAAEPEDLADDGGVLKTVTRLGVARAVPPRAVVCVHYEARGTDGVVYDSSRGPPPSSPRGVAWVWL
jgi:hypothetical protein